MRRRDFKKTRVSAAKKIKETVSVLYQNIGGEIYAFAQVGGEIYFAKVPVQSKAVALKEFEKQAA